EHAHEVSSAMEGDAALLPSGLDAEGDSEVSLAGADRSRKKHVVAALDPPAASKLGERAGLDVVGGGEVELVERLVLGEARRFEPRANRRLSPGGDLGREHLVEIFLERPRLGARLPRQ